MRIVFVGAVRFSRHCLGAVLQSGGNVVGVFQPRPEKATINADYADLSTIVADTPIPYRQFDNINDLETVEAIRILKPDVIFAFGLSQLINPVILVIPPKGVIVTHPALLPCGRGRHPLIWTLIHDHSKGGLTFFHADQGTDTGDILYQVSFPITDRDDATSLYRRIETLAEEAMPKVLELLETDFPPRIRQNDSQAVVWRKRGEADGEIDWKGPARRVFNLVRALTHPYVGAHTYCNGQKVIVWSAFVETEHTKLEHRPGSIVSVEADSILVSAGDGLVRLKSWDGLTPLVGDTFNSKPRSES